MINQIEVKPVLLKEELMAQTITTPVTNFGARGRHTFDDDDDDDLEFEGDEADDNSTKPRDELSSQLSKYYMGFEGKQADEGQEEQQFYDLYYNYDGSESQENNKTSTNMKEQRTDAYQKPIYHDSGRHYNDKKHEEADHERHYTSKNTKTQKNDQPSSQGRNRDQKPKQTSQPQQLSSKNSKQQKPPQSKQKEQKAEPSKQQKQKNSNNPYDYNDEYIPEIDNDRSSQQKNAQKSRNQLPNPAPQAPQQDPKNKQKTKLVYYVNKGEPLPKIEKQTEQFSYPTKTHDADYDYQNSYDGYNYDNYDYGYDYPEQKTESPHQLYPQEAYNPHAGVKAAVAQKQPVYTSKDASPSLAPKTIPHPGAYPLTRQPAPGYQSGHLGSYNYNQPTSFEGQPYKYYGEHDYQQETNHYTYGGRQEQYNFRQDGQVHHENQDWDYHQNNETAGSQILHKFYNQQRNVMPTPPGPQPAMPQQNYNYQAVKIQKPMRGGKN